MRFIVTAAVCVVAFSFAVSLIAYPMLPDMVASHWGINGVANGYLPKVFGLFAVPFLSLFLVLLFKFLPSIDPLKKNYEKFKVYYDSFVLVLVSFMFYVHLLMILVNSGFVFSINQLIAPGIGGFVFYLGFVLENAEQNWFVGIRTPWTLSSKKVWKATNERAGFLFKVSGLIAFLGVFFPEYTHWLIIAPIMFSAVYSFTYSFWIYRKS